MPKAKLKAPHRYKAGRLRPETAARSGGPVRGLCQVCGQAKKGHTLFGKEVRT